MTPLREGGSLPAIVEADNLGTYVLKFRGAGQGPGAILDLLRASAGSNLGVDFLPGAAGFDPLGWTADGGLFRRHCRQPAALVRRADPERGPHPFDARDHVLRKQATQIEAAHEKLAPLVTEEVLRGATTSVVSEWYGSGSGARYADYLLRRAPVVPEVIR